MEKRWGLLERSPQTPKNFSRICYKIEPVSPGFSPGDARGGEALGGFLKEAPKPPRTFLEFLLTATGVLRRHQKNRFLKVEPVSPGFSPGDARGEAPCIRKQKNLPLPVGKGVRGMGAGKYAKGKADRQQKGKPPTVTTPSLPAFPYSRKVLRGPGDSFKSPPAFSPSAQENPRKINPIRLPREFLKKPLTNARRCGIIRPVMEA